MIMIIIIIIIAIIVNFKVNRFTSLPHHIYKIKNIIIKIS